MLEARVGVEPTNGGFADLSLGPLGYRAEPPSIAKTVSASRNLDARKARNPRLFFCGRQRRGDFGFAQESSGFLGWRWVDVKAGAPFETSNFGQFGYDLDVPVVVIVDFLADGRRVDHEVVCR